MSNTISDVLTRIDAIQQQIQSLQNGSLLDSQLGISGDSTTGAASTASTSADSTSSSDFANELAAAQDGADTSAASTDTSGSSTGSSNASLLASLASVLGSGTPSSLLASGGTGVGVSTPTSTSSLPSSASSLLTSGQQQFASTLSAQTGLNPSVVTSWLLAEESGGAAASRQAAGNNDWLNIGYTDSATYGASDSVWSDPVSAANATAEWLKGQDSIPGYGTASSGIQSILGSVGQTPAAQIQAIQGSGWSSSGYPSLDTLYGEVAGASATTSASSPATSATTPATNASSVA